VQAELHAIQSTLDELTPPAARLYGLFVATMHEVQRAGRGVHLTHPELMRFKRAAVLHRIPSVADPAKRSLAFAMFDHELAKEVLQHQNALIEGTLHRAGHIIGPLVGRLRASSGVIDWSAVWPSTPSRGPLAYCPVQGPHSLYDTYGAPRPGGRVHVGNDILASQWTPVVAPVSGEVVRDPNTLGGNAVIEYAGGSHFYFAHFVAYGAEGHVQAGTIIGFVGNSGDAKGLPYHVHVEFHPGNGSAIDPYPLLAAAC
jgi:hypothetical protein